jgi:hypothetical protein
VRSRATLLIIAKSPQPGRVKTRLCPPCTAEEAASLAEAALADTLEVLASTPARRHVIALDGPAGPWLPAKFDVVSQRGRGLAERLAHAFADIPGPAFLVGMDTPQLTVPLVSDALATLARADTDAVLGPALDGGWWGIGLRRPDRRVFDNVEMSTARTFVEQQAQLRALGLRTRELVSLRDVDEFDDALAVAASAPTTRFAHAIANLEPRLRARAAAQ